MDSSPVVYARREDLEEQQRAIEAIEVPPVRHLHCTRGGDVNQAVAGNYVEIPLGPQRDSYGIDVLGNAFVVPADGDYELVVDIYVEGVAGSTLDLGTRVDGVSVNAGSRTILSGAGPYAGNAFNYRLLSLTAGQLVTFFFNNTGMTGTVRDTYSYILKL